MPPKIEELRVCTRAVIEENVLLLDADPENFSDRKNIFVGSQRSEGLGLGKRS